MTSVKTPMTDREEILKYLDKRQSELYTKFSAGHLLSNKRNCENFLMMVTYYRRNLHRFAEEYLGLKLHWYQQILLYFMGRFVKIVDVAARNTAKSYTIGVYAVCIAILYPGSVVGLVSGTRGQAKLIISNKIIQELYSKSPRLRAEIKDYHTPDSNANAEFHNGSKIVVITLGGNATGWRTTVNVIEEAWEVSKKEYDKYIKPFLHVRPAAYFSLPEYSVDQNRAVYDELAETPKEIFISSSIEDTHWLYKEAREAMTDYFYGKRSCFFAFDYAIVLQCGFKTKEQLIDIKRHTDPITWAIQYENAILRSNTKAYFDYDTIRACQTVKKAFYPRKAEDFINKKVNSYAIPKQEGEIRIVSCDIAFVDRAGNDNSSTSCLRMIPDIQTYGGVDQKQFKVSMPYLEASKGKELRRQAIRIRQIFADFDADYIVLDVRNAGLGVMEFLSKPLYDDDRCIEYAPIKCMNDETYNRACTSASAQPIVYCVTATAQLNSRIAINFKGMMLEKKLELLVPKDDGIEEIKKFAPEYLKTDDPETQLTFENPYLQTMLLFSELINLEYEKNDLGVIKIKERPSMTKDRYTSTSYGCWFASELSRDLLKEEEVTFDTAALCVSTIPF